MTIGESTSLRLSILGKWGVLLRAPTVYEKVLVSAQPFLERLSSLVALHGGVPTRANDFFLFNDITDTLSLTELTDRRLGMTKRDTKKYRVIEDGIGQRHRVESEYLRRAVTETKEIRGYRLEPSSLK